MSDFADNRTVWKGLQLGYDELLIAPNDTRECAYCLTIPQAKALLAVIDFYRYRTRWYFDGEKDKALLEQFVNDIQRRLMMPCGCDETGVIYAYNSDGVLTQSNDGGTTYFEVPGKDPRNNSPLFPPPMGEDPDRCQAADSAVNAIIVDVFDQLVPEMNRDDVDELIRTWLKTYVETSNPFQALITVIVNLIFGMGVDLVIENLTTEVWNQLRCCFLDTMKDDFSYDDAAWEELRECITNEIGGIAGIFLEHLIFLAGRAGATNLVRAGRGAVDADCDACGNCNASIWTVAAGDIVSQDECTIVITPRTADSRIALTTGSSAICGYFSISGVGVPLIYLTWPCGSGSPVSSLNPEANLCWNYDSGNFTNGIEYTFTFHNEAVFP